MRLISRAVAAGLLIWTAAGCGGPSGPTLYPVTGRVTLTDGSPIKYGHVILHPDAAKGNTSKEVCQGTIRDGTYVVMTGARKGAPLGAYRVTIEAAAEVDEANPYFTEWYADEKYASLNTSKLTAEVVEGPESGRYDFQLDPNPKPKKPGFLGTGLEGPPTKGAKKGDKK
jgi:hypothetical protein